LDAAEMHQRAAMRAARIDDLRLAGGAAEQRVALAHDANGPGAAGGEILAALDRQPELAHELAAGRAGLRGGDVDVGGTQCARRLRPRGLLHDGHGPPPSLLRPLQSDRWLHETWPHENGTRRDRNTGAAALPLPRTLARAPA